MPPAQTPPRAGQNTTVASLGQPLDTALPSAHVRSKLNALPTTPTPSQGARRPRTLFGNRYVKEKVHYHCLFEITV